MSKAWTKISLGEACYIEIGRTPPRNQLEYWDKEYSTDNVWLSIADLTNTIDKRVYKSRERISPKGAAISKIVKKGTLLVSFKLTLGRLALAGRDLYTNEAIAALSIKKPDDLYNEYLYYYLLFMDWDAMTTGDVKIKGKTLNKEKLAKIQIMYPSFPEQQRIVAILDQTFAAIAKAKVNAEKNLQNARELFDTFIQNLLSNKNKEWIEKNLGEIFEIARGGSPRPISAYLTTSPDGINWIKIGDTQGITKYIYKTEEKIKPEGAKRSRIVHEGDFLLSNSMSFGKPFILKTTGCIHDGWLVLSEKEKNVNKDFIYYVLGSKLIFKQFDRLAAGSTVRNLNIDLVKKVIIPLPNLQQQMQLVEKIENLSSETMKLERHYQEKLSKLEEVKKSILQKAFNGEL